MIPKNMLTSCPHCKSDFKPLFQENMEIKANCVCKKSNLYIDQLYDRTQIYFNTSIDNYRVGFSYAKTHSTNEEIENFFTINHNADYDGYLHGRGTIVAYGGGGGYSGGTISGQAAKHIFSSISGAAGAAGGSSGSYSAATGSGGSCTTAIPSGAVISSGGLSFSSGSISYGAGSIRALPAPLVEFNYFPEISADDFIEQIETILVLR